MVRVFKVPLMDLFRHNPGGVTSSKPGKLFLHVFELPLNNQLMVPGFKQVVTKICKLADKKELSWHKKKSDLFINMQPVNHSPDEVFVVEYEGKKPAFLDKGYLAPVHKKKRPGR